MIQQTTKIVNKLGLHARASAKFVAYANRYSSEVIIRYSNQRVNGKSILGVMMLAVTQGAEIELIITGEDEEQALAGLLLLIAERFGEEE